MSDRSANQPPRAVALRYDGEGAPRVTAKGRGHIAERIIEIAQANDSIAQEFVRAIGEFRQTGESFEDEVKRFKVT